MRRNAFVDSLKKLEISGDILTNFVPNPGGQVQACDAMASGKKTIFVSGANDTGKSFIGTIWDAQWTITEKDREGKPTGYQICPYRRIKTPPDGIQGLVSTWSDKAQQNTLQPLIEKIMGKYIKGAKKEGGAYHYIDLDGGRIDFFWQAQGVEAYRGPKKNFCHLDEPHRKGIFHECQARLSKFGGTLWNTLTPVADSDTMSTIRDLAWLRDSIIIPYENNPASRPTVAVVYMDLEENPFHNAEEIRQRNMGMSDEEIQAREHGRFILYVVGRAFNHQQVIECKKYLIAHPEVSIPQYGYFEYDPQETNIDKKIYFVESRETFADKVDYNDGFIVKIWEKPLKEQMGVRCDYYIGVDASGGKSKRGDPTSVYVKRGDTHQIVAALHGYLDEVELANQLWLLGHYYCGVDMMPATVCIETTNYGRTTLQYLQTGLESRYVAFPPYEWTSIYHEPSIEDLKAGLHMPSDSAGFFTSVGKRPFLVSSMRISISEAYRALQDGIVLIPDVAFFTEAENFIRDRNGVYKASEGETDDRLFSSALADMALKQANAISPTYRDEREPERKSNFYIENGIIRINTELLDKKSEPKKAIWI